MKVSRKVENRQVMYYVMVRSVLTAIRGVIIGWGKLERKATVKFTPERIAALK